jgi:imidazole glycerol-phosphate synthase subunit HisF
MIRIIPRLDIKGPNLIKSINFEGLRVIGDPSEYAKKYYHQGADEIIYIDCVASLYGRNNLDEIVTRAAQDVFVPMTVGGGIRSIEDATRLLRYGADKLAVNTAAVANPDLISDIASTFGSQCFVLSVEAKQVAVNKWEAYTSNGRDKTGLDVIDWVKTAVSLGAGEVLLTSVDREGTRRGFDIPLNKAVAEAVNVPVIASGGMGRAQDLVELVKSTNVKAVAMADLLHYDRSDIATIKDVAFNSGIKVRRHAK